MIRRRRGVLVSAALLLALATSGDAPLRLEVSPRLSIGPVRSLHIRVWVTPNDANRFVGVALDGDAFFRQSVEPVNGAQGARVHDVWWSDIPCGVYAVTAQVFDTGGTARATSRLCTYYCESPPDDGGCL